MEYLLTLIGKKFGMKTNNSIRNLLPKDKDRWEKLYRDYANFYKVEMNDKILNTLWNWVNDKNHEIDVFFILTSVCMSLGHLESNALIFDETMSKLDKTLEF